MEGWMHGKIMLLSHTLIKKGSDVASLVESPSGLGGDSMMDRWMDGRSYERYVMRLFL